MDSVKVSVIVPVYKSERYLVQCLESILCQSLREIEVIIVDEGDLDRCRQIIDYYEAADPRVIAVHEKNGGYGASVNKGIDRARGEYLGIVEADDFVDCEMYEGMYEHARRLAADVVRCSFAYHYSGEAPRVYELSDFITERSPVGRTFSVRDFPAMLGTHPAIWSGLYRTEYMRGKGIRCNEAKGAGYIDGVFRLDTLINTDRVAWLPTPYYHYRRDNDLASSALKNWNLSVSLQRWKELHQRLEDREDLRRAIGPYIAYEEYLNTVEWLYLLNYPIKKADLQQLEENLQYVDEAFIKTGPLFSFQQRKIMLLAKKDIGQFVKVAVIRNEIIRKAVWLAHRMSDLHFGRGCFACCLLSLVLSISCHLGVFLFSPGPLNAALVHIGALAGLFSVLGFGGFLFTRSVLKVLLWLRKK